MRSPSTIYHFGGVSPINAQNRALIAALRDELRRQEMLLPVYFGNRNWEPYVTDTIAQMRADGVQRALVFVTSAFSSYSGCRQYREDVIRAVETLGEPEIVVRQDSRNFYNHPGFIETMIELTAENIGCHSRRAPRDDRSHLHRAQHSRIRWPWAAPMKSSSPRRPAWWPARSELPSWRLAYQSRSGSPAVPWLEPDILDVLDTLPGAGFTDAVIVPIGFVSDHMEVLFDLDHEAADRAAELGLGFQRVSTAGIHPRFVTMIRELIEERMTTDPVRPAVGSFPPLHDICPLNCCLIGTGRPAPLDGCRRAFVSRANRIALLTAA